MNKPKVSWILPVYNAEKYLAKTIESVISQTYHDWELIIINDGSTDGSLTVINSFSDSRIKLISRENKGLSATLNEGILLAQGEYIARIDADDVNEVDRLEHQVSFLESNLDYLLVASNVEFIDEKGNVTGYSTLPSNDKVIKRKLKIDNCIFHPSVLVKKNTIMLVGGYDEDIGCYWEDYNLWLRLTPHGKFYIFPRFLVKYRVHNSSISKNTPDKIKYDIKLFKNKHEIMDGELKLKSFIKRWLSFIKKNRVLSGLVLRVRDFIKI